jgi:hypothetical protein
MVLPIGVGQFGDPYGRKSHPKLRHLKLTKMKQQDSRVGD